MTILIDPAEEITVDLNQGVESDPATPVKGVTADPIVSTKELDDFTVPDKFKGKTAEEIARSYVELEKHQGNLNNQLGDYRSMTDRFLSLEEKRVADLESAGAEKFEIDATDLLANPEKVMDEYFEHRRAQDPAYTELQTRLDRIEGQVGQTSIQGRHADAAEVTNDPAFQAWVGAHPVRAGIAQSAVANKDLDQLDYLLTEWKERQPAAAPTATSQQDEISAAQRVATESVSASGNTSANSDKRFSRRKLVQLKMHNPDEYSAMSDEILLAYAQKRVDD